ncbi:MAG: hypothetical protein PGN23_07870 [Sphingomonas adhaesiva]|uniref:hypothetical protein n=1 Tax=Sphingomonas adhaesiva TaxID=28212 RepID=UPI002FF51F66
MIVLVGAAADGVAAAVDGFFHGRAYLIALFGSTLTGLGVCFTAWQIKLGGRRYEIEQGWKRSELVRSYLSQMTSDPNIALTLRILDWRGGPAQIPAPFQPLFDAIDRAPARPFWHASPPAKGYFDINWDRFVTSLKVMRDPDWRSADMFTYRSCFDSFCTFLQAVADDVRAISVSPSEYADLSFYCHRVMFPKDAAREDHPQAGAILRKYIEEYYNDRTYRVIARIAEEYAKEHDENCPVPSIVYPELFISEGPPGWRAQLSRAIRRTFGIGTSTV